MPQPAAALTETWIQYGALGAAVVGLAWAVVYLARYVRTLSGEKDAIHQARVLDYRERVLDYREREDRYHDAVVDITRTLERFLRRRSDRKYDNDGDTT